MKRAFANFQPDLNLRNPLVLDELVGVLDFWMDLGIDGFRVDAIGYSLGKSYQNFQKILKNAIRQNLRKKLPFRLNFNQAFSGIGIVGKGSWKKREIGKNRAKLESFF